MRKKQAQRQVQPLKLTIVTQFYPPDYAATGQLIAELSGRLSDLGIEVYVFTGQPGYAFKEDNAPPIEQTKNLLIKRSQSAQIWTNRIRGKAISGLLFWLRSASHLFTIARRSDILLLTTAPPYLPILGYLANRLFGIPYICLLYDLYPDIAVELHVVQKRHWLTRCWNAINHKVWQHAQQIIVLSSTMKERITAKNPDLADKISIVHNWANPDHIVPLEKSRNWFAQQWDLVEKFTVLYSGNMGRCHDMETILATAIALQQEPIQFVFIGGGAKREEFINTVRRLGLSNCSFLPYQDQADLPYSLTACDLALVSVSPGMEGLVAPSKFYSSLAAGRPVAIVCEPHSYLRQIVDEAGCGQTFEHDDSQGLASFIQMLANNPQKAQQMGMAGRHYLQSHFTPDIIARQYAHVLYQGAQRKPVRSPQPVQIPSETKPLRL
ncbi:MAG TPA: glycosyltransferase family 4 protein [Chroococcidiopsis sp.]